MHGDSHLSRKSPILDDVHIVEGRLLLSPSDLVGFLACEHLTQLELAAERGELVRPQRVDPELELLRQKGFQHESLQLERLTAEHGPGIEIGDHIETLAGLAHAEAETLAAMRSGVPLIYQAAFFDGRWRGRADFLLRVEAPSDLGSWSYEVADAKLARSVKVAALLQMCEYSLQVARLQGTSPAHMRVILGTGLEEAHRVADYDAYFRAARARLELVVSTDRAATYTEPVAHCGQCTWRDVCDLRRRADDHLCLVAGMRRDQTRRLNEAGISTVAELAQPGAAPPATMNEGVWERLHQQAELQVEERRTARPVHDLIDCDQAGLGLAGLPEPSAGDLFFDMEGDPFIEDGGLEYLFGVTEITDGDPRFTALWGHDRASEKAAFESLIDLIMERLERDPRLHVYHYAQYEPVALKRLMSRHATREDEVDRLLRAGVFVDLYQVVRQGVRVSRENYSLKSLEVFYMPARSEEIGDAVGSIVAYERWRETRDPAELTNIAAYNQRDCESTWRLRGWLEGLRDEWLQTRGWALPRPQPRSGDPSERLVNANVETQALVAQLTDGVPADPAERSPDAAATWLLAQLLDWHRREDKSAWWAFYDRQAKTDDELVDDAEAIGRIRHLGAVRAEKKSVVHCYAFDAAQEYKLGMGDTPCDPRTGKSCGTIVALDDAAGTLELKRGPTMADLDHPTSLIPRGPIDTAVMRDALRRLAEWVIANGVDEMGSYRACRDLLLRQSPRITAGPDSATLVGAAEDPVEAAMRIVRSQDQSLLPVQGPPGAGKTYTGAQIIVDQVQRGHRVGVCATTHRAIGELLTAICEVASEKATTVRILQKCDEEERCPQPSVRHTAQNAEVDEALATHEVDVVAGTAWMFCRPELEGALDLVVIDEAGQMSLATALGVGTAADNLVLLGDPQQLAQPSRGIHPAGVAVSSLEHVLDGEETLPPDKGVFLPTTRRMHPDVCAFISTAFYDGRLLSNPDCARQRIDGNGLIAGTGLRLAPVTHVGNRTWSPEEVSATRTLVDDLLTASWTDATGHSRAVQPDDILVVAPYNLHVRKLREALPEGIRVGTVDKFQGQEAPVAIYAMATSSAEDVPRNLEFLFSRNRLNVAVSRARALAITVCSPLLLQAGCRTPEQLGLVSALCRFAEMATAVEQRRDPEAQGLVVGAQTKLDLVFDGSAGEAEFGRHRGRNLSSPN